MKRVLISVIGSPKNPERHYARVTYQLGTHQYTTRLLFQPLLKHYLVDEYFLLGTEESIWDKVNETRKSKCCEYHKVIIPFGRNNDEIWKIFETIINLPLSDVEVIFDITHGFRAIPMAIFLALYYFKSVRKDIHIKHVLYGNYEARDPNTNIAPVIELSSYLEMMDWIDAAKRFIQYGDANQFLCMPEINENEALKNWTTQFKQLSYNLQLNYISQVTYRASMLRNATTKSIKEALQQITPYGLLKRPVSDQLAYFTEKTTDWEHQWKVADWFYENRQYSQSVIVLREMLLTFTCDFMGWKNNRKTREEKASYLHTYLIYHNNRNMLRRFKISDDRCIRIDSMANQVSEIIDVTVFNEWCDLIKSVQDARNNIGHAMIKAKHSDKNIDPLADIEKIQSWISISSEIMKHIWSMDQKKKNQVAKTLEAIYNIGVNNARERLFIIVNAHLHPILDVLRNQYGKNLKYAIVSHGNVGTKKENELARRVQEIINEHRDFEYVVVPGGMNYMVTVVYGTIFKITNKHPLFLHYNAGTKQYEEKNLDPRDLLLNK